MPFFQISLKIISELKTTHHTFLDCRGHFFPTTLLEIAVYYSGTPLCGHPLNTDTRVQQIVSFVSTKSSYIFSKINPHNTDNGHFSVSQVTNFHISSTPLYGHWFNCALQYFHCHNHELIVDIVLTFKTMTDFCKFIRLYNLKL